MEVTYSTTTDLTKLLEEYENVVNELRILVPNMNIFIGGSSIELYSSLFYVTGNTSIIMSMTFV